MDSKTQQKQRGAKKGFNKSLIFLVVALILLLPLTFAVVQDLVQANFDLGTYTQTTYNTSSNAVELTSGQTSGTFLSRVFNSTTKGQWFNISWTEGIPYNDNLPGLELIETVPGGANMTGNVVLMHFDTGGTNWTSVDEYSGRNHNGTLYLGDDTANVSTDGQLNNSFEFDGKNDFVNITPMQLYDAYSISLWFKTSAVLGTLIGYDNVTLKTGGTAENGSVHLMEIRGPTALDGIGKSFAVGDFNGDGFNDTLTADQYGTAMVFYGPWGAGPSNQSPRFANLTLFGSMAAADAFGSDVAAGDMNGDGIDDIIVGEYGSDKSASNAGAVYVLYGSANLSTEFNMSLNSNLTFYGILNSYFGWVLATGDVNNDSVEDLAVGGYNTGAGRVDVIFGHTTALSDMNLTTVNANITINGETSADLFGYSVGVGDINNDDYDDIVVSSYSATGGGITDSGIVYAFFTNTSNPPTITVAASTANITIFGRLASDSLKYVDVGDFNNDNFEDIVFGSSSIDVGGTSNIGGVYVLFGVDDSFQLTLINQSANVSIEGNKSIASYGIGDNIVIADINNDGFEDVICGSTADDPPGVSNAGAVQIIFGSNQYTENDFNLTTINANQSIGGAVTSGLLGKFFGSGDMNNDGILDIILGSNALNAYIVFGSTTPLNIQLSTKPANFTIYTTSNTENIGSSLASGDINGDGLEDLIIGADVADAHGMSDTGAVYMIFGSNTPIDIELNSLSQYDMLIQGNVSSGLFGQAIASGDFNNDGFDDVAISASTEDPLGRSNAGVIYVILGSAYPKKVIDLSVSNANVNTTIIGNSTGTEQIGFSLTSGDINGDGFDDILSGSLYGDAPSANSGVVYVIFGSSTMPLFLDMSAGGANVTYNVSRTNSYLGYDVAVTDFNNDGFDDIITGGYGLPNGGVANTGQGFVFFGSSILSRGINVSAANITILGNSTSSFFTHSVAAGDFNGDGFGDAAFGAYQEDPGGRSDAGEAYIIYGGSTSAIIHNLSNTRANVTIGGNSSSDNLGRDQAFSAGDINGDGIDDLLIGVYSADPAGLLSAGIVYALLGSTNLTSERDIFLSKIDINYTGSLASDTLGFKVLAVDMNNDSIKDIVVSATGEDNVASDDNGAVFVISTQHRMDHSHIQLSNGSVAVQTGVNRTNAKILSKKNISDDAWHNVVFVKNNASNQIALYVDGIIDTVLPFTQEYSTNFKSFAVGAYQSISRNRIDGNVNATIDELAIFNRTLTAAEVSNFYQRGALTLNFSVKTCASTDCSDAGWNTTVFKNGTNLIITNNTYFQYRAEFETLDSAFRPILYNVTIEQAEIDPTKPVILLSFPANNTNISSLSVVFNFTVNEDYAGNNNCSLYVDSVFNQSNATIPNNTVSTFTAVPLIAGAHSWNVSCTAASGQSNMTGNWTFFIDASSPNMTNVILLTNATHDLDPQKGITINVTVNELYSGVDTVMLMYNNATAWENITMTKYAGEIYSANLTLSVSEANYTFYIWANDTLGNFNQTGNHTFQSGWDCAFNTTTTALGQTLGWDETKRLGNLTIYNIGDANYTGSCGLSFRFTHDRTSNVIFFDLKSIKPSNTYDIAAGINQSIQINATFLTQVAQENVIITMSELNGLTLVNTTNVTATIVSSPGGPYLFETITSVPSSLSLTPTSFILASYIKNLAANGSVANTAYNVSFNWTLPGNFTVSAGSTAVTFGNLSNSTEFDNNLTIGFNAVNLPKLSPGISTVYIYARGYNSSGYLIPQVGGATLLEESSNITLICYSGGDSIIVTACGSLDGDYVANTTTTTTTTTATPAATSGGGGGGGGGAGSGASSYVSKYLKTAENFEVVRGQGEEFDISFQNPYAYADLVNLDVSLEGIFSEYLELTPKTIAFVNPRRAVNISVRINAPKYFTEGEYNLTLVLKGKYIKNMTESDFESRKFIILRVLEISREEAISYLNQSEDLLKELDYLGIYSVDAQKIVEEMKARYSENRLSSVKRFQEDIINLVDSAKKLQEDMDILEQKITEAQEQGITTSETLKLLRLTQSAYLRGDFKSAKSRLKEAQLSYAVEVKGEFNIEYYIMKHPWEIGTVFMGFLLFLGIASIFMRWRGLKRKLKLFTEEEKLLFDMMKVVQRDCFEGNKLSMDEYENAMFQYESRLNLVIQGKIETETKISNILRFKSGQEKALISESNQLKDSIKKTQEQYFEEGKLETRIYENMLKSYSSRLSDIDEKLAMIDAQKEIKLFKWRRRKEKQ